MEQNKEDVTSNPFTLCVIGECGQGKSTLLTNVSQIFGEFFTNSTESPPEFMAVQSAKTVTQHVRIAQFENM